jgi:urease accessory protein
MEIYDTYEGNSNENATLSDRLEETQVETVTVDDDQRRRSRFRAVTEDGTEIGVVLARELRAGDVLSTSDGGQPLVRIALEPIEALAVDLTAVEGGVVTAVGLGHAAGNRHWDMAVRDGCVLFPATESADRMRETVEPHLPDGATLRWDSVSPATFDGGDGGHGTGHGTGHTHEHAGDGHVHVGDLRHATEPEGDDS